MNFECWAAGTWAAGSWVEGSWCPGGAPAPSAGNYVQRVISRSVVFPVADIEELRRKARQRREEEEIIIL
jgi:hypothetical protein